MNPIRWVEQRIFKRFVYNLLFVFNLQQEDDEILSEIKRVATELSALAEFNHNELMRLHTASKIELQRGEIKRKLDIVDQEVSVRLFCLNK